MCLLYIDITTTAGTTVLWSHWHLTLLLAHTHLYNTENTPAWAFRVVLQRQHKEAKKSPIQEYITPLFTRETKKPPKTNI